MTGETWRLALRIEERLTKPRGVLKKSLVRDGDPFKLKEKVVPQVVVEPRRVTLLLVRVETHVTAAMAMAGEAEEDMVKLWSKFKTTIEDYRLHEHRISPAD